MVIAEQLFWPKVAKSDGCWEWLASKNEAGYGRIGTNSRGSFYAHRISYELRKGAIPPGFVVDHLCRNTSCVNPAHLEAVPQRVNVIRGYRCVATHCKYGHEFTQENSYHRPDNPVKRECLTCRRSAALRSTRRNQK